MAWYHQGDIKSAMSFLSQIMDPITLETKQSMPERAKVEVMNMMVLASLKSPKRDLDTVLQLWQPAIRGAKALQSEQRFNEALLGYTIMDTLWPGEQRIKDLRELTIHW